MTESAYKTGRWTDYVMASGDAVHEFWHAHLASRERDLLVVGGIGFDPRNLEVATALLNAGGAGRRRYLALGLDDPLASGEDKTLLTLTNANGARLETLFASPHEFEVKQIQLRTSTGRRTGDRRAADLLTLEALEPFTDIVLDVSGLPRGVYLSMLAKLLHLVEGRPDKNLHVAVAENPELDAQISEVEVDEEATFLYGFPSQWDRESSADAARVLIPVLGPGKTTQLEKIAALVNPDIVCPVLPSPSVDPRRADLIFDEYREMLLHVLESDSRKIVHACEWNPFEAYRQLVRTITNLDNMMTTLAVNTNVAVAALSSKLLSIGTLLAAYDVKMAGISIGIANADAGAYRYDQLVSAPHSTLYSLWLAGECYES